MKVETLCLQMYGLLASIPDEQLQSMDVECVRMDGGPVRALKEITMTTDKKSLILIYEK